MQYQHLHNWFYTSIVVTGEGEIKIEERGRKKKGAEWSLLGVRGKRSREGNSHQNLKMRGEELRDPYYDDEKCER